MADESATFKTETVQKLLQLSFKDEKTKINKDALKLTVEMIRIFAAESAGRSAKQGELESAAVVEPRHFEKILPQLAKKNGASSVEIDLEMTSDGVAVLLHDATVNRTTDGTGYIKDMTFEEVRKLNAAANFGDKSESNFEQIPTVEEAVQLCKDLDMNIFFDVKNYSAEMQTFLVGLYQKYPHLYKSGMVCSFFPQVIYQLRRSDDQILTALTTQPDFLTDLYIRMHKEPSALGVFLLSLADFGLVWSLYNWLWFFVGNSAVLLKHVTVSKNVVKYWQERDVSVVTWTVNANEGKDHFMEELNVPVITDVVKREQ